MSKFVTLARGVRDILVGWGRCWSQFWFASEPTTPLELARIGIGVAMLFHYALATPYLFELWGEAGWMPHERVMETYDPWQQSLFFYFTAPWQLAVFDAVFLFCCFAFAVGWRTSWVKWIVLIGQISFDYRNPDLTYGADKILACLLFILCLAPIGRAISLDRVRALRLAKAESRNLEASLPAFSSPWAGACTRLMQIQMATLFFYSAIAKLQGDDWWSGDAVWTVFITNEHYNSFALDLFAHHYWLVNVATYGTILIELAYTFLIWQRSTRSFMLVDAFILHLMFALLMGLYYFSFIMMMGHMSFVRPEWITRLRCAWKRKFGDMEMIYDGNCGFCYRSMVWYLSFDGLGQIKVRDFRAAPSAVVSNERMEKALHLVLPDGRAYPGFEAYRYAALRVPGLWWQIPFFYVPIFSRLFGHPLYNWIASNRSRLSAWLPAREGKAPPRHQAG